MAKGVVLETGMMPFAFDSSNRTHLSCVMLFIAT